MIGFQKRLLSNGRINFQIPKSQLSAHPRGFFTQKKVQVRVRVRLRGEKNQARRLHGVVWTNADIGTHTSEIFTLYSMLPSDLPPFLPPFFLLQKSV